MRVLTLCLALLIGVSSSYAQEDNSPLNNPFKQLGTELPTPNVYRNAAGAPGPQYWQQQADYKMKITLDDENQRIYGEEKIKYHNNSPDALEYIWLQLDQNMRAKDSDTYKIRENEIGDRMTMRSLQSIEPWFDGGFKLDYVKGNNGQAANYTVNKTMMRIDLDEPLQPGENTELEIKWWYNINDRMKLGGRSGLEYFEEEDNYIYTIAQFFPRMCTYTDNEGWQNKQFLGRGEFALVFGDYEVEITAPADHLVAATGTVQNMGDVLSKIQMKRWEEAKRSFVQPVLIQTQAEAEKAEKGRAKGTKTWKFKADNVRDFAFASSRKFIWDAMAVKQEDGTTVMAASMYPKEGNPLWEQYSTKAVAHTLKWYSHYTFPYPYPIAYSIHTRQIGMEYPMICFNYGRPEKDGTYPERTKYGMIGVIIHEVGHNYFPMIVNSDERQWTWMDEGLNTFLQYLTEQEWERNYPHRRGPANKITDYMGGDKTRISPIMTNSESIFQFGNNAYGKPATALNILRETIMGRELFDYAFKRYSNRWRFKHPEPADLFRTMEDASGVDLDWFWRGWFFGNDHVDLAIADVQWYNLQQDPQTEEQTAMAQRDAAAKNISDLRTNDIQQTYDEADPTLRDFYTTYDPLKKNRLDQEEYEQYYNSLSDEEKAYLRRNKNYYQVTFRREGELVMPIIVQMEYTDGSTEEVRIPAEIWRMGQREVTKVFASEKELQSLSLDPFLETADVDVSNNYWPPKPKTDRFKLFKQRNFGGRENPMQRDARARESSGGTN